MCPPRTLQKVALVATLALCCGCPVGAGLDRAGARCEGVTCTSPPPTVCVAPGVQRTFQPAGRCQLDTGLCEYPVVEEPCPLGCFESKRCRQEGDELVRLRYGTRWALTEEGDAVLVAASPAPGCDAGVFEVRTARLPGLLPEAPRTTGCRAGWATEKLAWPMVHPGGVVVGFEGLTGSILAYWGGAWLLGGDGGVRLPSRAGRPAFALEDGGGVFWAGLDVAMAVAPDGTVRWTRPCPGTCGSSHGPYGQPLAAVIPGRALVSCRAGCSAFALDGTPLFTAPSDGGVEVDLLLVDSPERVLVSPWTGGLEALPLSGGDAGRVRFEPPAGSRSSAAVVEEGGTVLLAWWAAGPAGTGLLYFLSRLEPVGLTEQLRVPVTCRPSELVARRDGSTLLAVWCPDDAPEPGPSILVLDAALEVTARLRPSVYSRSIGPISVDERGTIWVTLDGTLVVMAGTQPPARSPWPMVRADAQNTSRAHLPE